MPRFALAQMNMSSIYEENIAKADYFIEKASKEHVDCLLLPELFTRLYFCQIEDYESFSYAEERSNSKTLKHFQKMAERFQIVLPISFFEKAGNCFFNSLVVFDKDGKDLGLYRKSHIPTGACYEEKFYFAEGDTGFKVFHSSCGNLGIGICWDQWFPETARILALKGADILMFPTAIGSEPILPFDSMKHWQNVMRGHASANIMPLLAANRFGKENIGDSSMIFYGSSFIADEHGEIVSSFNREEEGLLYKDFDFQKIANERQTWGVFRDRRIDLYSPILKKDDTSI